jgi:hypothetical protein
MIAVPYCTKVLILLLIFPSHLSVVCKEFIIFRGFYIGGKLDSLHEAAPYVLTVLVQQTSLVCAVN